jgi:hypothetical protein
MIIDTSGSMEGDRIETVKKTLNVLFPMMGTEDSISIISYNSDATVLCACEKRQDVLQKIVGNMNADGMTHMEAGILKLSELPTVPSAVFLLTDGQINRGIQSSSGLNGILERLLPRSVPIYTLGYGEDHNIEILRAIAVKSRGTYAYAESSETIPETVGMIVGSLVDEAAKEVVLKWRGAGAGAGRNTRCLELGWSEGVNEYFVGNMVYDKDQWVVLEEPMAADEGGSSMTLEVHWKDPATGTQKSQVVGSSGGSLTNMEENEVRIQWIRARQVGLFENLAKPGILTEIEALEADLLASNAAVQTDSMMIRTYGLIQEMKEKVNAIAAGAAGAMDDGGMTYRMAADMTAYGMQRGTLSMWGHPAGGSAVDGGDTFMSPTQRTIAANTVTRFSQAPVE